MTTKTDMDNKNNESLNGIPATMCHDEGAIAKCFYCGRYSLDPATLSDRQPVCECGKQHGWSGSFKKPGPDALWSGKAPALARAGIAAPTDGEIERAALKHVATGFKQLSAGGYADPDYRKTEQFARLKAFACELFAAPTGQQAEPVAKCRYCGGDGEHYQGPSQYAECEPCNGTGHAAPVSAGIAAPAAPTAVTREFLQRCLSAMRQAVEFGNSGRGRPPAQTCMFEVEELEAILAAPTAAEVPNDEKTAIARQIVQDTNDTLREQAATMLAQRKKIQSLEAELRAQKEGASVLPAPKLVGQVVMYPNYSTVIQWVEGVTPPSGTKLYSIPAAPAQPNDTTDTQEKN